MAELTRLSAEARNEFGKGASRRLRRAGRIPAVIYGNHEEPVHVHVDNLEFHAVLRNEGVNAVVELVLEGAEHLVMIKSVDQNVLTLEADHADLMNVKRGEKVEVEVPVVVTGTPAPGALAMQDADTVAISVEVLHIPEEIEVNIEGKEIHQHVTAADLVLPAGAELVSEPDTLIVNIIEPVEEELPEPGEEGAADAVGDVNAEESAEESAE